MTMDNEMGGAEEFKMTPTISSGQPNISQRLENLRWCHWHSKVMISLAVGWGFDAFEITIINAMLPVIMRFFQVDSSQASIVTSIWLFGGMVGGLSFGYITDRYGRKFAFVITMLLYSIFTIVSAFSPSFTFLLTFRFLTAIGVGAEYVTINTTIAELIPGRHRGKANGFVMSFWVIGALIGYGIQIPILSYLSDFWAWRIGLLVGGLASIYIVGIRSTLVESPRWLLSQGYYEEALKVTMHIELLCNQPNNTELIIVDPPLVPTRQTVSFFNSVTGIVTDHPFLIILGSFLNAALAFTDYGVTNIMSLIILPQFQITQASVAIFFSLGMLGSIPGYLLTILLIDKLGRKFLLVSQFILVIISIGGLILVTSSPPEIIDQYLILSFGFYQFAFASLMSTIYPTITEIFPTYYRGIGLGISVAVGRILASTSPPILLSIYHLSQDPSNFLSIFITIIVMLLSGLGASLAYLGLGIDGIRRSLDLTVKLNTPPTL